MTGRARAAFFISEIKEGSSTDPNHVSGTVSSDCSARTSNGIIDENGAAIENPDLTLGYLVDDTEPVEHPAVEGVEEVSHYETVAEYPNGGKDVQRVVDVPGVPAQAAWTEQMPVQRYIRYTAEELAAQEEARKKQEAKDKLPETVAALNAALADADALNLDQDYRMTLLELGVTDDETTA